MRYKELDSMRGLAALFVVFSHCMLVIPIYGGYKGGLPEQTALSIILRDSPLHLFWSGHESVILFFLLSGFVLSLPFYNKKQLSYGKYIIRRTCRIYIPYVISIIFAISMFSIFQTETDINGVSDWFNKLWDHPTNIKLIISHVFFIGDYNTYAYNSVIWSLAHEMRISLLFPLLMIVVMKLDWKKSTILSLIISFISLLLVSKLGVAKNHYLYTLHYLTIFIVGALLAKHRYELIGLYNKITTFSKITVFMIGTLFYTYSFLLPSMKIIHKNIINEWMTVIGAAIFVILAMSSNLFKKILSKRSINYIGEISYSLYLYHMPILIAVIYVSNEHFPLWISLVLAIVISIIVSSIAYYLVEKPSVKIGRKLSQINFKNKTEYINNSKVS
ncbi:acyltransferase [Bacillus sp. 17RED48]|uniref:acyltransferase family protein n=1 Tax=Bacillus sp. 17RED48 TaxID=2778093 RepID=UPI001C9AE5D0|nr:acyltransferase [Bacillus sp. 17RED48]MBY7111372.1 acyltransferase [Bacillus sp. 17RED48]